MGGRVIDVVNAVSASPHAPRGPPIPIRATPSLPPRPSSEIRLNEIQSQPFEMCVPQIQNEPAAVGCADLQSYMGCPRFSHYPQL